MFHSQQRSGCAIIKFSIIRILTVFDPLFNPVKVSDCYGSGYFSVFTVPIFLQWAYVSFEFNFRWICAITADKLSIISIFVPFDPILTPLEMNDCHSEGYFSLYTVPIYLWWIYVTFVCNLQGIFSINMQICWIISILVPFLDILGSKFPKPDFFQPTIFMFREEIYLTKHVISIKVKYNASDLIYSQKATILRDFGPFWAQIYPKSGL